MSTPPLTPPPTSTLPDLLGGALTTARRLLRDCVPAAILDTESVIFVLATEVNFNGPAQMTLPMGALRQMDRFASEFDELMRRGHAWVNFNVAGIHDGHLVVVLETPPVCCGRQVRDGAELFGPEPRPCLRTTAS